MNRLLKRYAPSFLLLALLMGLVVCFRSFLMTNVIEPIALFCWAIWRIISSVDQNIYWMAVIAICSIWLINIVSLGGDKRPALANNYQFRPPSRIEYWQTLIKDAILEKDEAGSLRDSLQSLLLSALMKEERSEPMNWEEASGLEKVPLSDAAHRFLFPPRGKRAVFLFWRRLSRSFLTSWWLGRWMGKLIHRDMNSISEILERIESEMELSNDR